jgi:hypothetical protein
MKNFLLFIFALFSLITTAQNNCPPGYSQRYVKCHGNFSIKCIPDDYNCKQCWNIEWKKCDGTWNGGLAWHSSYEQCLADGERTKNGTLYHDCPGELMNKYEYRIYCDDSEFCDDNKKANEEKAERQRQQQIATERKQQEEANRQAATNRQNEINNQQQQAAQQRQQQYQNQMQALQQQLATRQQANAQIANTLTQGIQ